MRVAAKQKKARRTMGIDPGHAKLGIAVVDQNEDGTLAMVWGGVIITKKADKKARNNLRVTNDDVSREKLLCKAVDAAGRQYRPTAVGVEGYRVRGPMGGGQAAKTMGTYMGVVWWATTVGIPVAPFLPDDLRRRFCPGKKKSTKEDVERSIRRQVLGADKWLNMLSEENREHLADAIGHAVLIHEDLAELDALIAGG